MLLKYKDTKGEVVTENIYDAPKEVRDKAVNSLSKNKLIKLATDTGNKIVELDEDKLYSVYIYLKMNADNYDGFIKKAISLYCKSKTVSGKISAYMELNEETIRPIVSELLDVVYSTGVFID